MKENNLEFYVNKFCCLNSIDGLDLSFIPPIVRRRMSSLDKLTLFLLNETYTDNIQYIVFSSQFGQIDRLLKIISQYQECKEVSPNTFSGSVHNYSVSSFLLNRQISIPYTSVAAGEESLLMGLLSSVISNYDNVLFCYADINNGECNSLAINLTKKPLPESSKYKLKLESNSVKQDTFKNFVNLFSGKLTSIKTPAFTVERVMQ